VQAPEQPAISFVAAQSSGDRADACLQRRQGNRNAPEGRRTRAIVRRRLALRVSSIAAVVRKQQRATPLSMANSRLLLARCARQQLNVA
jgi:hypothetical protein